MKAVVQRVSESSVICEGKTVGEIKKGFLVLLGVTSTDTQKEAEALAKKIAGLRVFTDQNDKMNLGLKDIDGGVLAISNFTLYADVSHGRRPSFINAARPDIAEPLYEYFIKALKAEGIEKVECGVFGGDMTVNIVNDGPVTIIIDTNDLKVS